MHSFSLFLFFCLLNVVFGTVVNEDEQSNVHNRVKRQFGQLIYNPKPPPYNLLFGPGRPPGGGWPPGGAWGPPPGRWQWRPFPSPPQRIIHIHVNRNPPPRPCCGPFGRHCCPRPVPRPHPVTRVIVRDRVIRQPGREVIVEVLARKNAALQRQNQQLIAERSAQAAQVNFSQKEEDYEDSLEEEETERERKKRIERIRHIRNRKPKRQQQRRRVKKRTQKEESESKELSIEEEEEDHKTKHKKKKEEKDYSEEKEESEENEEKTEKKKRKGKKTKSV